MSVLEDYAVRHAWDVGPIWMSRMGRRGWLQRILHRASVDASLFDMAGVSILQDGFTQGIRIKLELFVTDEILSQVDDISVDYGGYVCLPPDLPESREKLFRMVECGLLPPSAIDPDVIEKVDAKAKSRERGLIVWHCQWCGWLTHHTNLRGNEECDGCAHPL